MRAKPRLEASYACYRVRSLTKTTAQSAERIYGLSRYQLVKFDVTAAWIYFLVKIFATRVYWGRANTLVELVPLE